MPPMSLDDAFGHASRLAMLGWLALILLPRWRGVSHVLSGLVIPATLSLGYVVLIAVHWHDAKGGFSSLDGVATLFQSRPMLLAGWVHYLAFDLFLGAWILRRSQEARIPHLPMVPVLLATFLFGPSGFLLFLLLRASVAASREDRIAKGLARLPAWPRALDVEPRLAAAGLAMLALMIPTAFAHALDIRVFQEANIWLKPLKFEASLGLYLLTLALFLPLTSARFQASWLARYAVWGAIVPSFLEIAYILWRASRAEASHYNIGTPLDAALYGAMGLGAVMLTASAPVIGWGIARKDAPPLAPALRWSIVIGLALTFVLGVGDGAVMSASRSGHFVGSAPLEHATLPILGWSLAIGDLRVAHFLGLHALHVIPAFGLLVCSLTREARPGLVAVGGFSAAYALVTVAAFAAAMNARPLLGIG
jgi:hypothetical protein